MSFLVILGHFLSIPKRALLIQEFIEIMISSRVLADKSNWYDEEKLPWVALESTGRLLKSRRLLSEFPRILSKHVVLINSGVGGDFWWFLEICNIVTVLVFCPNWSGYRQTWFNFCKHSTYPYSCFLQITIDIEHVQDPLLVCSFCPRL